MPHFCADEALAIIAALPFIGYALQWARVRVTDTLARWRSR